PAVTDRGGDVDPVGGGHAVGGQFDPTVRQDEVAPLGADGGRGDHHVEPTGLLAAQDLDQVFERGVASEGGWGGHGGLLSVERECRLTLLGGGRVAPAPPRAGQTLGSSPCVGSYHELRLAIFAQIRPHQQQPVHWLTDSLSQLCPRSSSTRWSVSSRAICSTSSWEACDGVHQLARLSRAFSPNRRVTSASSIASSASASSTGRGSMSASPISASTVTNRVSRSWSVSSAGLGAFDFVIAVSSLKPSRGCRAPARFHYSTGATSGANRVRHL